MCAMKISHRFSKPAGSRIDHGLTGDVNYLDSFSVNVPFDSNATVDYAAALVFTLLPSWAVALLKLRNLLVTPFGLETDIQPDRRALTPTMAYQAGERAVMFTA